MSYQLTIMHLSECWRRKICPLMRGLHPSASIRERVMMIPVKPSQVRTSDMKLEVIVIPVANVDRAKEFYGGLGWGLDADFGFEDGFRVIQFTPPGYFGHLRHQRHRGDTRLRERTIPGCLRHRGRAQGATQPRCKGQRAVSWRRRCALRIRRAAFVRQCPDRWPGPRTPQLFVSGLVQRSGRQRLDAPGNYHPASRSGGDRYDLYLASGSCGCTAACRSCAWRA
jgi:catechol 2,3-dioxygenase-like lactoylglutathione lyase family enzyme